MENKCTCQYEKKHSEECPLYYNQFNKDMLAFLQNSEFPEDAKEEIANRIKILKAKIV